MSRSTIFAILIALAGIAVRLATFPLSLGCDEPQTAAIALSADWAEFWRNIANDSNPPLIHLILRGWAALFGGSDASFRTCVLIISSALPPICYLLVRRSFSEKLALQLAALAAFNATILTHSEKVRSYGLMIILTFAASCCLVKLVREGGWRWRLAYAALLGASLWAHGSSIVVLGAHGILLPLGYVFRRLTWQQFVDGCIGWIIAAANILPLLFVFLHKAVQHSVLVQHSVNPLAQLVLIPIVALGSHDLAGMCAMFLFWAAVLICWRYHAALAAAFADANFWFAILACMFGVEFIIGLVIEREPYLMHFALPCLLIYLLACDRVLLNRHAVVKNVLPVALLVALWSPTLLRLYQTREVAGTKKATEIVNAETRPLLFVVSREWLVAGVDRYLTKPVDVASLPHLKPGSVIDYTGLEPMLRDDASIKRLQELMQERLRGGERIYHLMSRPAPGFSITVEPDENFDHLEQRRSVEVEEWLSKHARLVDRREFPDCAGAVVLEIYDPI